MKKRELVSLTQLRFVAASMVFVAHMRVFDQINAIIGDSWVKGFGNYSVALFYILSGFVLAYNYGDHSFAGGKAKAKFIFDRFCKIWPSHILLLIAAIPLVALGSQSNMIDDPPYWVLNISLLQGWAPKYTGFNTPAWSLSCEAFFYVAFPFIFVAAGKRKWKAIVLPALVAIVLVYILSIPRDPLALHLNTTLLGAKQFPATRIFEFILGIGLYKLWCTQPLFTTKNAQRKAFIGAGVLVLGLLLSFATLKLQVVAPQFFHTSIHAVGATLVMLGTLLLPEISIQTRFGTLIHQLGNASFAFYLLHDVVLRYAKGFFMSSISTPFRPNTIFGEAMYLAAGFVLVQALSIFWYQRIETPLLKFGRAKNPFKPT